MNKAAQKLRAISWLRKRHAELGQIARLEDMPVEELLSLKLRIYAGNRRKRKLRKRLSTPQSREQSNARGRTQAGRYAKLLSSAKRHSCGHMTFEQYQSFEGLPCHYCGWERPISGSGIDRANCGGGYEIENSLPCCWDCNNARSNRFSVEEMLVIGQAICRVKCDRFLEQLEPAPVEVRSI